MFFNHKNISRKQGMAAITIVFLFLVASLVVIGGISFPILKEIQAGSELLQSKHSYYLSEAALEDVAYRIFTAKSYDSTEVLMLNGKTATTTVTDIVGGKEIDVRGDVSDVIRKVKITVSEGVVGVGFFYGAHIGGGGLEMTSSSAVNGNVYSNGNIVGSSDSLINGDAAAVGTISSPEPDVTGTKTEGVPFIPFPPIDIDFWRAAANVNSDPYIGNYSQGSGSTIFGPKKFDGDFSLNGDAKMTITGPIHITGDFAMNSDTELFLDASFGSTGTVIVVDGTIEFNSKAKVYATAASPRGYILFVTPSVSASAISLNSDSILEAAVYATAGTVSINSAGDVIAVTAYKLKLNSDAEINYDLGLASSFFTSGPGGGYSIGSWEEIK